MVVLHETYYRIMAGHHLEDDGSRIRHDEVCVDVGTGCRIDCPKCYVTCYDSLTL